MELENIVYSIVVLIAVAYLSLGRTKDEYKKGFKMAAVWLAILLTVTVAVVYAPELKNTKIYAALVPGAAVINEDGSMEFTRASDGHFHIDAEVEGVTVKFMVDTGASDISLSKADAKKIGILNSSLVFDKTYRTANGLTRGASVRLKNISVGTYQTGAIYASVNEGELDTSLLGLTFLNKLKSYRFEGDKLILQP